MPRAVLGLLSGLFGALCLLPATAFAYESDVHYDWTYYLALRMGYSVEEAFRIASSAFAIDEDPDTGPLKGITVGDGFFGANSHGWFGTGEPHPDVVRVWANYHGFDPEGLGPEGVDAFRRENSQKLWKLAREQRNPGPYIHYLQDIYSHGGYDTVRGHALAGYVPDYLASDMQKAQQMTETTIAGLSRFMREVLGREPGPLTVSDVYHALETLSAANGLPSFVSGPDREKGHAAILEIIRRDVAYGTLPREAGEFTLPQEWFQYDYDKEGRVEHPRYPVQERMEPGDLWVRVVDEEWYPLPGAQVKIIQADTDVVMGSVGADEAGDCLFSSQESDRNRAYRIDVSLKGYEPQSRTVTLPSGESMTVVIQLQKRRAVHKSIMVTKASVTPKSGTTRQRFELRVEYELVGMLEDDDPVNVATMGSFRGPQSYVLPVVERSVAPADPRGAESFTAVLSKTGEYTWRFRIEAPEFEAAVDSASFTVKDVSGGCPEVHAVDPAVQQAIPEFPLFAQSVESAGYDPAGYLSGYTVEAKDGIVDVSDWQDPNVRRPDAPEKPVITMWVSWFASTPAPEPRSSEKVAEEYAARRDNAKDCGEGGWDIREGFFGQNSCMGSVGKRGAIDINWAADPYEGHARACIVNECVHVKAAVSIFVHAPPCHGSRDKPRVIEACKAAAEKYVGQVISKVLEAAGGGSALEPGVVIGPGSQKAKSWMDEPSEGRAGNEPPETGGGRAPARFDDRGGRVDGGAATSLPDRPPSASSTAMGGEADAGDDEPPDFAEAVAAARAEAAARTAAAAQATGPDAEAEWEEDAVWDAEEDASAEAGASWDEEGDAETWAGFDADEADYDSGDPLLDRGDALLDQGRLSEAEEAYAEAARREPKIDALIRLGDAQYLQEKWGRAEQTYRQVVDLFPDDPEGHALLGEVLIQQDKWNEAEAAYREAIRLEPDNPAHYGNLGAVLEALGRMQEAQEAFRKADALMQ